MDSSDPIDRVREARRRISSAHDNDAQRLLTHYEAMQERYRDRLVRIAEPDGVRAEQAAGLGNALGRIAVSLPHAARPTTSGVLASVSAEPQTYWAAIHVVLTEALPVGEGAARATGYYWTLGVTCDPDVARAIVERHVRDGSVDWSDSEVSPIQFSDLEPEIQAQCGPRSDTGIWYESGRAFHGPD